MPYQIVVVHDHPAVAEALTEAFGERGFACTAVQTIDDALDDLCRGGRASVILYDGSRSDTPWIFGRAQEANPALLNIPLIALSPLNGETTPIDLGALLLILNQLCRNDALPSTREISRET
jgi:CheY-like chemotaxis protein